MKESSNIIDFTASRKRSLQQRIEYSFIHTYKPVIDDGTGFRSFPKISDYKKWAQKKVPKFLGYGKSI